MQRVERETARRAAGPNRGGGAPGVELGRDGNERRRAPGVGL